MENKKIILIALAIFGVGIVSGRYLSPEKVHVKIEEKIVIKEVVKYRESKDKRENKDKEVIVIETTMPDGTKRKETHTIDKGVVRVDIKKEMEKQTDTSKQSSTEITTSSVRDWNVAALASPSHSEDRVMNTGSLSYGVHVQRRIIGPFQLGAFGLTNKNYGFSLGFSW